MPKASRVSPSARAGSASYRPELAEAIAVTLTEAGHERRIYDVTTRDSVTLTELAGIASAATGRAYRYEPGERDEWEARWRAAASPSGRSKPD